MNMIGVSKL